MVEKFWARLPWLALVAAILGGLAAQMWVSSRSPAEKTSGVKNAVEVTPATYILHIDRSKPFDPSKFIGEGWTIWKGPADGDGLTGEEDQDERSLAITELDLSKIRLETCLKDGEDSISGEEKLRRLKMAGYIQLDARVLQACCEKQYPIFDEWRGKLNGYVNCIFFSGTIIRSPKGDCCILNLRRDGGGWYWDQYDVLGEHYDARDPSAVLEK